MLIVVERAEFRLSRVVEEVSFWKYKQCGMGSKTLLETPIFKLLRMGAPGTIKILTMLFNYSLKIRQIPKD